MDTEESHETLSKQIWEEEEVDDFLLGSDIKCEKKKRDKDSK